MLLRTARVGQARIAKLIDALGFTMPPANAAGEGTPPSTAVVLGQIAGAPRRVHRLAGVVLASLIGRGASPVKSPTLVKAYDYTRPDSADQVVHEDAGKILPDKIIRRGARPLLRTLLQAPLCYAPGGRPTGTLKSLAKWCAARRAGLRLHFAKTGTQVTLDPDATVDAWIAGGLQFNNGAAYSYVVVVGTGSAAEPWARNLHASQVAAPLLDDVAARPRGRRQGAPAARSVAAQSRARPSPSLARNVRLRRARRPSKFAATSSPTDARSAETGSDRLWSRDRPTRDKNHG